MIEIFGALFIIAVGCVGHFIFDWTNHSRIAAIFFAINESTWEHIKLTIYPSIIWLIAEIFFYYGNPNLLPAHLCAMLAMILLIPFLFYGYTLFTRKNFLFVDILCFCVSICLGMWLFHSLISLPSFAGPVLNAISLIGIIGICVMYVTFSYNPPRNFIFRDPITRRYGISGHPCMHHHHHHHSGTRHPEIFHHEAPKPHEPLDPNLDFLRSTPKVYFVAMEEELDADSTKCEVVYTGVGKARAFRTLMKYIRDNEDLFNGDTPPLIVNIGTAGSHKYRRGDIVLCESFVNNGSSFVRERLDFSVFPEKTTALCASSDYFISEKLFTPGDIESMRQMYDCFDMEAFALANVCAAMGLNFCAVKCISDGTDDTMLNFDAELPKFRAKLNEFVRKID